ncbi:hypothetical protein J3459_015975 [Metarhizium acridum]|nr:hypothetical protein J3459_015975 [Metarhizium acridum]
MPGDVQALYDQCKNLYTRPSFDEIFKIPCSVRSLYSRVFIIADALDECHAKRGWRDRLPDGIFRLQEECGVNIMATSRALPEIASRFRNRDGIHIRAKNEDVKKSLESRISKLPTFVMEDHDLRSEIITTIAHRTDGILFGRRAGDSKQALDSLPREIDATYKVTLSRIKSHQGRGSYLKLARRVLGWLVYAKKVLAKNELRYAVAVELGTRKLNKAFIPSIDMACSVCAGLVTLDAERNLIRLAHDTTQQYFEVAGRNWLQISELDIAEACITWLLFDVFASGNMDDFEGLCQIHPLYSYACDYWGHHARSAPHLRKDEEAVELVLGFLRNSNNVCKEITKLRDELPFKGSCRLSAFELYAERPIGIHIAAHFWTELYNRQVDEAYTWAGLGDRRTPAHYAAAKGHTKTIRLLLENGANKNAQDCRGQALQYAIEGEHEAGVELLVSSGASIETRDSETTLVIATKCLPILQLPLKRGANIDERNELGQTPLMVTIDNMRPESARHLVASGANVNLAGDFGLPPLWIALRDSDSETILSLAARCGVTSMVELLLKRGARVNNSGGVSTPLHEAVHVGHVEVTELLLDNGAELDVEDKNGRTPLSIAAAKGKTTLLQLLLRRGAGVNFKAKCNGLAPLHRAAEKGNVTTTELLCARGGDINIRDELGQTSLHKAVEYEKNTVVKLLCARGADVNIRDSAGQTPLHKVAWFPSNRQTDIAKLLIASGSHTHEGRTPLFLATSGGNSDIAQLLLSRGADGNAIDKD